eukprot:TRINITY_DN4025_c0_g1_i5.p1 TRINITY_DN4025_c0_g1~~TRINITY_DN4025_c0_g1_i5.p1  ORF type:complete len:1206 (-),score=229.83 TRINITY_DN4025_c0_g1_i5:18-3293(-)
MLSRRGRTTIAQIILRYPTPRLSVKPREALSGYPEIVLSYVDTTWSAELAALAPLWTYALRDYIFCTGSIGLSEIPEQFPEHTRPLRQVLDRSGLFDIRGDTVDVRSAVVEPGPAFAITPAAAPTPSLEEWISDINEHLKENGSTRLAVLKSDFPHPEFDALIIRFPTLWSVDPRGDPPKLYVSPINHSQATASESSAPTPVTSTPVEPGLPSLQPTLVPQPAGAPQPTAVTKPTATPQFSSNKNSETAAVPAAPVKPKPAAAPPTAALIYKPVQPSTIPAPAAVPRTNPVSAPVQPKPAPTNATQVPPTTPASIPSVGHPFVSRPVSPPPPEPPQQVSKFKKRSKIFRAVRAAHFLNYEAYSLRDGAPVYINDPSKSARHLPAPYSLVYSSEISEVRAKQFERLVYESLRGAIGAPLPQRERMRRPFQSINSYAHFWIQLLYTEEMQQILDMRQYDLINETVFYEKGVGFSIEVPGLAENRPSLAVGDKVNLFKYPTSGVRERPAFQGQISKVQLTKIFVKFHRSLPTYDSTFYLIQFETNRAGIMRQHTAVDQVERSFHLARLFAAAEHQRYQVQQQSLSNSFVSGLRGFLNPAPPPAVAEHVARYDNLNLKQSLAVSGVLNSRGEILIVFGPPGTGKTTTLISAIIQLCKQQPQSRILVTAPSNSAVDLIVEKLAKRGMNQGTVLRVNAVGRDIRTVSETVRRFCTAHDDKWHCPTLSELQKYQVVLSTLTTAGMIYGIGGTHFTHVFVDEAGQATEPETLIAFSCAEDASATRHPPCFFLFGDPRQLGPLIRSRIAESYGFHISLLERLATLIESGIGTGRGFSQAKMFRLDESYRSNEHILQVYNQVFYENTIIHRAPSSSDRFCGLPWLKRPGMPIIFHHVAGVECQDEDSPSWFNPQEIDTAYAYLDRLTTNSRIHVSADQVGFITPYRKQVEKMQNKVKRHPVLGKSGGFVCGTVERWQGGESDVVIISTVRVKKENLEHDKRFQIGFLSNPKRLNVSISRAKGLLIIVGCASVLLFDPHWAAVLKIIVSKDGFVGPDSVRDEIVAAIIPRDNDDTPPPIEHFGVDDDVVGDDHAWRQRDEAL